MNIINFIWNSIKYLINPEPEFTMEEDMNILNSFKDIESSSQFSPEIKILQIQYSKNHQLLMNTFRYILI